MFLFLEKRILSKFPRKAIFQEILSRNWKDPVISEFRKEGPKELPHEPASLFDLIIFKFKVNISLQQCLLLDKVVKRAFLLPNFSNFIVFGIKNLVSLSEKSNISNIFGKELVRSCNFQIRKRRSKGAPARPSFCL